MCLNVTVGTWMWLIITCLALLRMRGSYLLAHDHAAGHAACPDGFAREESCCRVWLVLMGADLM